VAVTCCIRACLKHPLPFLLKSHLFLSIFPQEGQTPLHKAAQEGHSETMQTLIAAGADIDADDKVRCARFNPILMWNSSEISTLTSNSWAA
jgi:hypothetical protein